jgi:hypothetical protein
MITPGGEHKSWRDMTPQERKRDKLRHFPTMLARWRGGHARMWELTVSLKSLTIRVERKGVTGNLHVACIGPVHIQGPVCWDMSDIEIVLPEDHGNFVVRDVRAGVEIETESIELKENCEPVFTLPA